MSDTPAFKLLDREQALSTPRWLEIEIGCAARPQGRRSTSKRKRGKHETSRRTEARLKDVYSTGLSVTDGMKALLLR
jgi:hypothetical protein